MNAFFGGVRNVVSSVCFSVLDTRDSWIHWICIAWCLNRSVGLSLAKGSRARVLHTNVIFPHRAHYEPPSVLLIYHVYSVYSQLHMTDRTSLIQTLLVYKVCILSTRSKSVQALFAEAQSCFRLFFCDAFSAQGDMPFYRLPYTSSPWYYVVIVKPHRCRVMQTICF